MHPMRARQKCGHWPAPAELYARLTLAFTLGLYLPWTATAPDLARHFGEAVHTWAILFLAPLAVSHLFGRPLAAAIRDRSADWLSGRTSCYDEGPVPNSEPLVASRIA
jgi:hypothetical protein